MNKKTLMEYIQSFVLKTGYTPLDMKVSVKNDTLRIAFSIFKQGVDISLDDCSNVTLIVRDFLNMLLGLEADFVIDVSSPGADRKLKTWQEYSMFQGKKARITFKDGHTIEGVLKGTIEPDQVVYGSENDENIVSYDDITSCRLVLY
jgi:ribosome maturation factor RimP